MKAMILAAGFGVRLRPLTDRMPKALLPVANLPQLFFTLEMLRRAGVTAAIINLHHLGGRIRAAVGDCYREEVRIAYSMEEKLLGTGGGLKKAEWFFGGDPFLLVNADTIMEIDLGAAVRRHVAAGATATMVVREWEEGGGFGRVEMDGEGRVRRVLGRGRGERLRPVVFSGVHVLSRRVFDYLPEGEFSCINRDCYGDMLEAGEVVAGFRAEGYWRDIGTPAGYFGANMDFLAGRMPAYCCGLAAGSAVGDGDRPGVRLEHPVIIGREVRLEPGCRVGPDVILGDGCIVKRGCVLERVVALPGASFGPEEEARGCIRSAWGTITCMP